MMNAISLGLGAMVLGILCHGIVFRFLHKRWRLIALPAFLLVAYGGLMLFGPLSRPVSPDDAFVALVLVLSLGLAHGLTLIGVIYDSPTLALIKRIESYGSQGMPLSAFDQFVLEHPFMRSRIDALVEAGQLHLEHGEVELIGRAGWILCIANLYRHLRGGNSKSG